MIFQNFGFNRVLLAEGGATGPTFPDQSLTTWTTTETAAWLSAGATLTTSNYGYSSTSTRLSTDYGTGAAKWNGAALASNGKIYAPGHVRNDWLIINTSNDTTTTTGSVNNEAQGARYDKITNQVFALGNGGAKINCSTNVASNISGPANRNGGAVQSFDGNLLYSIGLFGNQTIQEYNISANTSTSKGSVGADRNTAGTLAANGKIFWGSGGGTAFTAYTPSTNTITNFGSFSADAQGTMVAHYNGYLYNFPAFGSKNVIKVDPSNNSYSTDATISSWPTNPACAGAVIGLDGRIYLASTNAGCLWYDPYTQTGGSITMASGDSSYSAIGMGMYGDLYLIPWTSNYVHKISLTTGAGAGANAIVQQYNFGGRMCWQ